jgi:hypothetical protein
LTRAPRPPQLPSRRQARPTLAAESILGPTGLRRRYWYDVDSTSLTSVGPSGVGSVELLVDDFRRPVSSELLEFQDPEGRRVFRHQGDAWKAGTAREFKRDPFTSLSAIGPGLFFLGPGELRRLHACPSDWAELSDEMLRGLLGRAERNLE